MNRLIIADNQAIFRAGAARVLALEQELSIVAQCDDLPRLTAAVDAHRGAVILVASTLRPDLAGLIAQAHAQDSRVIVIAEDSEALPEDIAAVVDGVISRNIAGPELVESVRRVARGQRFEQRTNATTIHAADTVGSRVRDRLTPKEMQIVALIVQGCKNKDIASQLNTKEQVVKNYLRSIYDKTGVSDRLELALFTIHHRALSDAATRVGNLLQSRPA